MTMITPSQRLTAYSPTVSTTNFPVDFPIFDNDDLAVMVDGEYRTDFTITATYVDGISTNAIVVMSVGVTGDVWIIGLRPPSRTDQFVSGAPLPISGFNYSLNRLEIEAQEARRDIDRSHKAPFGELGGVFSAADIGAAQGYAEEAKGYRDDANSAAADAEAAAAAAASAAAGVLPYPYQSLAAASAAAILATVKRIRTLFYSPNFLVPNSLAGGAHYRRVSFADLTGVQTQAYFRSADRFMPDGTTDNTNGGYWLLDEAVIDWKMVGVQCDGTDETTKCQAAINFCLANTNRTLKMTGTVSVSKLTFSGASKARVIFDNCVLSANSLSAQTSLLEIKIPNFVSEGRCVVNANYLTNYDCAVWYWHETAAQFSMLRGLVANCAKIGFRLGNIAYPASLISETVIENPQTYGCPVAMEVVGGETYVTVSNPELSADSFGGNAGWQALVKCALRNKGATVIIHGGECIDTSDTNGSVFRQEPIDRGSGRVEWGSLIVDGTVVETVAPLCIIDNIGLTINNSASSRRGMTIFDKLVGFHSQDLASFIYVPTAYNDFVIVRACNFWKPGAVRTQPNIFCAGGSTAEITVTGDFGPGFISGLGGIQGGRVNFSRREIVRATGLNGQSFPSASFTAAKFQAADSNGDKPRFSAAYAPSTGIFTVPDGGLEDVVVTASLRMTGATTGVARLILNSAEVLRVAPFQGSSNFSHSLGNLTAGATLYVDLQPSANDTGIATAALSVLSITAKRGAT